MCWDRVIDAETHAARPDDRREPDLAPPRECVLPPAQEPIAVATATA